MSRSSSTTAMWRRWFVSIILAVVVTASAPPTTKSTSRKIKILNESGGKIEIYWVHPQTRAATLMSTPNVLNGADFPLNSYVGHEFQIREVPAMTTGKCRSEDQTCRMSNFAVSENEDQVITIHPGIEIEFLDDQLRAKQEAGELVAFCQEKARERLNAANGNNDEVMAAMEDLVACVEVQVADTLSKSSEEIAFQAGVRRNIAEKLENYTCTDPTQNTSEALEETTWRSPRDGRHRKVHVMHNRPASRIHLVENFITEDECQAMENAAKPVLHRATVADGKGGSHFSEHRKAMQAGIKVPWDRESDGDAIARLSRRVYDYTENVLGMGITEHGQEDLMSIQYFGRGENDTEPDRYTPHCDGDCTGLTHKSGTRMATMVMYCTIPESGGHTNFRNAGVHIKPQPGNAIFFSYIDPDTRLTDTGFTEHSGCPVFTGEKKIVTQWIRHGVDRENPWTSFNTLGIKKGEDDD